MPYLHWGYIDAQEQELEDRFRESIKGQAFDNQPRRSLDEAVYRYQTYAELAMRNGDQVVTRFLRKMQHKAEGGQKHEKKHRARSGEPQDKVTLMVIDQLWLWILDKGAYSFIPYFD